MESRSGQGREMGCFWFFLSDISDRISPLIYSVVVVKTAQEMVRRNMSGV